MSFYAVKRGRNPGVYETWTECQAQITGFRGPVFKKFPTSEEAWNFVGVANPRKSADADAYNLSGSSDDDSKKRSPRTAGRRSNTTTPAKSHGTSTSPAVGEAVGMLRATAKVLRSTAEQLLTDIKSLSSHIEQVAASVSAGGSPTLMGDVGVAKDLKRPYSGVAEDGKGKKAKTQDSGTTMDCGFTGAPFSDSEGVPVFTDGASINNGRVTAKAGVGVYWGRNSPHNLSERLPGKPTNNRAEIHAARRAVEQAKKLGIRNLILHTDSEFLINGITLWVKKWKKNGWKLVTGGDVINREDFEALDNAVQGINIKWVHTRGHKGIEGNEAADRLANEGAKKAQ